MPKPKTSHKNNQLIQFRIVEIKKLSHFENDPRDLKISEDRLKKPVEFEMVAGIGVNPQNEIVALKAQATFFIKENGKKLDLFGLTAVYKFQVIDVKRFLQDDTIKMPTDLISQLASLIISGMRGMLAALNTRPEYSTIFLPALNPASIIQLKEKK